MRILFAAPDRDLLQCYRRLLTERLGETVTAFDGAQVLALLETERFDLAVLDRALPSVEHKTLLAELRRRELPSLALRSSAPHDRDLCEAFPACASLRYPFRSAELIGRLRRLSELRERPDRSLGGVGICPARFALASGTPLCLEELELLDALTKGPVREAEGVYLRSLNHKLTGEGINARIRYRSGEGYRLVTDDEANET